MEYVVDPYDDAWWNPFKDTPAAFEAHRVRQGEPWTVCAIAGLQYHSWLQDDGMDGRHEPQPGDRLQLVREPGNPHDGNAVRVEWRNATMLGHLPRLVAKDVAAALDVGTSLRAYVLNVASGSHQDRSWNLHALLVGEPVRERLGRWTTAAAEQLDADLFGGMPTRRQKAAASAWDRRRAVARLARQAACAAAFAVLEPAHPPLPEGAEQVPDPADQGRCFSWWDQVPPCLMTATTLARHGFRPGMPPFASIAYGRGSRSRHYELFAVAGARRVRMLTDEQRAATAEAAVFRRGVACSDILL